tara:strand:+ start:479 stop:688 length:210 start_codon:yes stop_codon:yes gene_type:complete
MDKRKVESSHSLYRDMDTGAVINCNDGEYESYIKQKKIAVQKSLEIDELKNDVSELKVMMKLLLEKLDK